MKTPIDPSKLLDCKQYRPFNHRIGKLTEYFAFPDFKAVLDDLYGMEPPALFASEVDAIYGSISVKSIPSTATITEDCLLLPLEDKLDIPVMTTPLLSLRKNKL